MTKSDAVKLENDEKEKLLESTYINFIKNGQKMREYHVDTHSIFSTPTYEKRLSIRKDPSHTRPPMIIRQDKTVFKQ